MPSSDHLDRALEAVKAIREREGHRSADAAAERAVGIIASTTSGPPYTRPRPPFTAPPRWLLEPEPEPEPEREWWTGETISPELTASPHITAATGRGLTATTTRLTRGRISYTASGSILRD